MGESLSMLEEQVQCDDEGHSGGENREQKSQREAPRFAPNRCKTSKDALDCNRPTLLPGEPLNDPNSKERHTKLTVKDDIFSLVGSSTLSVGRQSGVVQRFYGHLEVMWMSG